MIQRLWGHALLTKLLGHAESIVRVSPADVLVLIGVDDDIDQRQFDPLLDLLNAAGVEARGLVVLTRGMTVDSIDMEELRRMDQLAGMAEEGTTVEGRTTIGALSVPIACPRCEEVLDVDVSATITDTGEAMHATASVDQTDLGIHSLLCSKTSDKQV